MDNLYKEALRLTIPTTILTHFFKFLYYLSLSLSTSEFMMNGTGIVFGFKICDVLLTLSSLGFFEHSQPGGRGGGNPLPLRNFFIINANQMKLCTVVN